MGKIAIKIFFCLNAKVIKYILLNKLLKVHRNLWGWHGGWILVYINRSIGKTGKWVIKKNLSNKITLKIRTMNSLII